MRNREAYEKFEDENLAPYACRTIHSQGREYDIKPCHIRTDFQRDRDRVIHSGAFRRLEYKTQVYVIHEGDYYRTRLTHTLEVAQIARTLSRALGLNVDLTEAVALAHDLGHTPFGHAGEAALDRMMKDTGGFEHNRQGIRIVEKLENRYADIPGLNLTYEVREGIAKHQTSYDEPQTARFDPRLAPTLEAQLVDLADELAYNHHDLDDAMKMGLVEPGMLAEVPWVEELQRKAEAATPRTSSAHDTWSRNRLIGWMIDLAVADVLDTTEANIREAGVESLDEVRACGRRLASFSNEARERNSRLRVFLMEHVYRHPHVVRMTRKGERFLESLFHLYHENPRMLPKHYQERIEPDGLVQVIGDYLSGMTDRFCLEEYARSFLP